MTSRKNHFRGKEIILGVTGSIAAYKAAYLASFLVKKGAEVTVIMSANAVQFISPLTFSSITGRSVLQSLFEERNNFAHIGLAEKADLFLVAPATANFIGKAAAGLADDALTTTLLSVKCPVVIAPAMNARMYLNPLVQENIRRLRSLGYHFVGPEKGKLACGEEGIGRMAEPGEIIDYLEKLLSLVSKLEGKRILITAGPTREYLDDIRFISNRSSGKMGYALAEEAVRAGAKVILISGPTSLTPPYGVNLVNVETALEMKEACEEYFSQTDVLIMAAAVSDFQPKKRVSGKLKKEQGVLEELPLKRTPDILKALSRKKRKSQIIVGFAAESNFESLFDLAKEKMREKKMDFVVANPITEETGFESESNQGYFIFSDGRWEKIKPVPKRVFAQRILKAVSELL